MSSFLTFPNILRKHPANMVWWTWEICQLTRFPSHAQDWQLIGVHRMYASLFRDSFSHPHVNASHNHCIYHTILDAIPISSRTAVRPLHWAIGHNPSQPMSFVCKVGHHHICMIMLSQTKVDQKEMNTKDHKYPPVLFSARVTWEKTRMHKCR